MINETTINGLSISAYQKFVLGLSWLLYKAPNDEIARQCFIQRLFLYCFTRLNFCSVSILANAFPSCCPTEFGERNEASEGNIISSQVMISSHFLFCGTSIYYS